VSTLRPATNADTDLLVALHERALRRAGTDPADVHGNEDLLDVEATYHEAGGTFLVCEAAGGIVAMGGMKPIDERTVELLRIAVAPDRQREGLGTRIVDALEAFAREAGFERAVLETAVRQRSAMAFYPARGYVETERQHDDGYEIVRFETSLD
jgi:GNAT superfamily N-acetyltransferase